MRAPGAAELSGKVAVGDRVTKVNGRSTRGLDYAAVLDMVIAAERPITLTAALGRQTPAAERTPRVRLVLGRGGSLWYSQRRG